MRINLSEYPRFKNLIGELNPDRVNDEHRTGRYFCCDLLFNIAQEDVDWMLKQVTINDLPPDVIGMWLSNQVIRHDDYGIEWDDVTTLTKVERKERQVTTTEVYYKPVNQ